MFVKSILGLTNSIIHKIPMVKKYQGTDYQPSSIDHIGTGCVFALLSIIAGMIWPPLFWLYLASWFFYAPFIEIVWDGWIKKKNYNWIESIYSDQPGMAIPMKNLEMDWPKTWAQIIERSVGHVIFLSLLIWMVL